MTIQQAIEKAQDGGYKELKGMEFNGFHIFSHGSLIDLVMLYDGGTSTKTYALEELFLDPLFWQSLGKAMGWTQELDEYAYNHWRQMWHKFIDHLIEGKDAQSFFESLN